MQETKPETISLGRWQNNPDSKRKLRLPAGELTLDLNAPSQRYIYECCTKLGGYEDIIRQAMQHWLRPGDRFIDVGAHVGYFTLLAYGMVGETGRVYAFEADPRNYEILRENTFHFAGRIIPFLNAVGNCDTYRNFYSNLDNDGGSSLWNCKAHPFNEKEPEKITVRGRRLDYFCDTFMCWNEIRAIKIDTEGAELEVLQGAERLLRQENVKLVICEHNPFGLKQMGATIEQVCQLMRAYGFRWREYTDEQEKAIGNIFFERV